MEDEKIEEDEKRLREMSETGDVLSAFWQGCADACVFMQTEKSKKIRNDVLDLISCEHQTLYSRGFCSWLANALDRPL